MDINKEREAFEQALVNQKNVSINNLHVCTIFDAEKNKYSPSDVCDPKEDFIVDWINSSWSIWQSAKAQTDQKIKLLLCDEHLKKCESPTGIFNSQYPDEEPCLICLAKQAKAQAVPEGFVLISAEQLSQWGHMANYAEQYGCPECFEARGYAHSLACEINAYFNVSEAQEPAND